MPVGSESRILVGLAAGWSSLRLTVFGDGGEIHAEHRDDSPPGDDAAGPCVGCRPMRPPRRSSHRPRRIGAARPPSDRRRCALRSGTGCRPRTAARTAHPHGRWTRPAVGSPPETFLTSDASAWAHATRGAATDTCRHVDGCSVALRPGTKRGRRETPLIPRVPRREGVPGIHEHRKSGPGSARYARPGARRRSHPRRHSPG